MQKSALGLPKWSSSQGMFSSFRKAHVCFRFIYCAFLGACKHPSQVGPIVERAEKGPEQHISCMNLEWQELIIDWGVETFACNDGSEIAASAYQCGHNGKLLWNHERHYAVACALSHLHKCREADEHS